MLISIRYVRCCSSLSAPTPCKGRLEKLGKVAVVLRRRFRSALSFTSLSTYTRDVSAHESAAVRRHFAPGAAERILSYCGLCVCLGRFGGNRSPLASMPMSA